MPWLRGGHGGLVEESYPLPPGGTPQGGRPPSDFSALGAGVYIEHGATASFTGCTFRDNVTRGSVSGLGGYPNKGNREHPRKNFPIPSYGAGIFADQPSTTFTDCTIQGNWTTQEPNQYEGDLYPYGSHPDPEFQYPDVDYTGYGGGMCFVGGTLGNGNFGDVELNHCNITDNNAPVGGGVFGSALTDFHIDDCNFVGNWAYLGAGLFSIDNNDSIISRSNFISNRADDPNGDLYGAGSGLFSFSSDVLISDCIISENTTNGLGAGLYMAGEVAIPPLTADPVLKNCLISDNQAGLDGGGIYCDWYAEPNIINCTITGNEARGDPPFYVGYGGGLYCSYESDVNIINSIFWGNAGPNTIGPELAIETGFDYEPRPAAITLSYCDIEGGQGGAWVDNYSTLNWGTGNINEDPLFVNGYYLSKTEAGQMTNSPCVDAGSASAEALGLHFYTTRTDSVLDVCEVDMGYHYTTTIEAFCDFDGSGDVDLADLEIFVSYWLEQYCHLLGWCEGADLDRDKDVDFVDYATFAQAYAPPEEPLPPPPEEDAPEPDPSEWEIEPHPLSSSAIHMMAVEAYDPSGGVQYQFECVGGGGHSSDWQDSREYTDTGLAALTEYTYRVRTRDVHENTGGYSEPQSATTLP
jgi:predicted outer membrane repeat protein